MTDRSTPSPEEIEQITQRLVDAAGGAAGVAALLRQFTSGMSGLQDSRPQPKLLARRPERVAYILRIDLDDINPPIWRRLRVASDVTLDQFHAILQLAMGWTDSHLHRFTIGPDRRDRSVAPFLTDFDLREGEVGIPESDVRLDEVLSEPRHRLFYDYDFGDDWEHTVRLEKIEPWPEGDPGATCLTGKRACPPEDVGGIPGYLEMVDALAGIIDEDNRDWIEEKLAWLPPGFDPEAFDIEVVNKALRDLHPINIAEWHELIPDLLVAGGGSLLSEVASLVAQATEERVTLTDDEAASAARRYQLLLDTVGSGLSLTSAGYLPPKAAKEIYRQLGITDHWWDKGQREDAILPVLTLRESATALGLVRKARGRLTVTVAGRKCSGDPHALLRHIGARLPLGRHASERDAGLLAVLRAAAGQFVRWDDTELGDLFAAVGWYANDGRQAAAAAFASSDTRDVLGHLVDDAPDSAAVARVANVLLQR